MPNQVRMVIQKNVLNNDIYTHKKAFDKKKGYYLYIFRNMVC